MLFWLSWNKTFFALAAAFLLSSCTSVPEHRETSLQRSMLWSTVSQDGSLVVIGVASRHLRREDEILAARYDAARKVAMFYGIQGNIESFLRTDGSLLGFTNDSYITLETVVDHESFIERLYFDPENDVFVLDNGTLVRFSYPVYVSPIIFSSTLDKNGCPNWINGDNLPEINGYVAAVGTAQNQMWLRDTVMRSIHSAAARMIENMSAIVQSEVIEIQTMMIINSRIRSKGTLENFRILELWIDPVNGHVYTLGIARFVE